MIPFRSRFLFYCFKMNKPTMDIDDNKILELFAQDAIKCQPWFIYGQYCLLRAQGLRSKSFLELEKLIRVAQQWPYREKWDFVIWVMDKLFGLYPDKLWLTVDNLSIFPHQLKTGFIIPVLKEAVSNEPDDCRPNRWLGIYLRDIGYFKKALEINPDDSFSHAAAAGILIEGISFDTHELPWYFLGDIQVSIQESKMAGEHINKVRELNIKDILQSKLNEQIPLLYDWSDFVSSGEKSFIEFCKIRGKAY
jgi:hypothetical protein